MPMVICVVFCKHFVYVDNFEKVELDQIEFMAMRLYGLIHARYILTTRGMAQMVRSLRFSSR